MAKSKDPSSYNELYYEVFHAALTDKGHTISDLTLNEAHWLRADLYAFRKALRHTGDYPKDFEQVIIQLKPEGTKATLLLKAQAMTTIGKKIASSLGDLNLSEMLSLDAKEELEQRKPLEITSESAVAQSLKNLGFSSE